MPISLTVCLAFIRQIKKLPNFTLTPIMIGLMTVSYSFLFEYIAPSRFPNQTGDWIDVGMYTIGAIMFWYMQKYLFKRSKKSV